MSALVWWAIPLVITALAIAFVALRSRVAEPEPDPMAERLRLREAMERSSRRAKRSSRRSPDNPREWHAGYRVRGNGGSTFTGSVLVPVSPS